MKMSLAMRWGRRGYAFAAAMCSLSVCLSTSVQAADEPIDAMIPVEVLPLDSQLATGEVGPKSAHWKYPRIALQPARAARGIAIEKGGSSRILVLALLGPASRPPAGTLTLDVEPAQRAWCEIATSGFAVADCFQDTDNDGRLEVKSRGLLGAKEEPLSLSQLDKSERIDPIAYRPATAAELPQFQIGYVRCGIQVQPDGHIDTLRFSTTVRLASAGLRIFSPDDLCNQLATSLGNSASGDQLFQVDRFKVAFHADGDALNASVVEGIAPGTILGHVRGDRPLLNADGASAKVDEIDGSDRAELYFTAMPTVLDQAPIGTDFLIGEVAHGLTGKLGTDVTTHGWSKSISLPRGTPLYGVSMSRSAQPKWYDATVVWCTPFDDDKGQQHSWCFVPDNAFHRLVENYEPHTLTSISAESTRAVDPPVVERQPVDFGAPLELKVQLTEIDRKYIKLQWSVTTKQKTPAWRGSRVRRLKDGSGVLVVGGSLLRISPAEDRKSAAITKLGTMLLEPTASAMPMDATLLMDRGP